MRRFTKTSKAKKKRQIIPNFPVDMLQMNGNAKWHEACNDLYQLVKAEPPIDMQGLPVDFKPIPERQVVYELLVVKYIQYIKTYQNLNESMKWLVHPQKRKLLKRCIEALAGRICEIKLEMISVDKSLFNYFDDILFDMGLTQNDLKIQPSRYLMMERYNILQMREQLLSLMIERMKSMENPEVEDILCKVDESFSPSRSSEASNKSRAAYYSTKVSKHPDPICKPTDVPQVVHVNASLLTLMEGYEHNPKIKTSILKLQCHWRGWLAKRYVRKRREEDEIAFGMRWPRSMTKVEAKDDADYMKRDTMWQERDEELQISKAIERERFMAAHGHNMAWELKYNITQWLLELRDLMGKFPDYPSEEDGGCERLFAMKTTEEVEAEIEEMLNPTPTAAAKEDKKNEQLKNVPAEPEGWKPAQTTNVPILIESLKEYNSYWYFKSEMDNVEQKFDRQLMLEEVREEAGKQIRVQVDELMRYELDKLRCGIEFIEMEDRSKAKKAAKPEPKEKVTKDPLAHKSVEELYSELVLNEMVIPVQKITFKNILGDHNFLDEAQENCIPTVADIKTLLTHLVVFPLTSESVHSILPLTNRLLLAGPSGTGKTMFVHALAREIGACLLDISPELLANKFVGGERQDYLMNALLKVGKSMEPTIFYMDGCESLFMRPAPGGANQSRHQRWVPVFRRMMDKMKKGDRMFLIGETTDPFTCNSYNLCEMFKNIIYVPRPEYGSRVILWREFLARMPICISSNSLNPSTLAQFSQGYSAQEIEKAVTETLSTKRLSRYKPVTNMEFLMALTLDQDSAPLDEEDVAAWYNWYASTPLMRRRQEMLDKEAEAELLAAD